MANMKRTSPLYLGYRNLFHGHFGPVLSQFVHVHIVLQGSNVNQLVHQLGDNHNTPLDSFRSHDSLRSRNSPRRARSTHCTRPTRSGYCCLMLVLLNRMFVSLFRSRG